ncbi:unnamed protein product [Phytophthora lilii]|uniref:Unnamed protein product n=1 Tax=Phytophthora lilii TaxID=2077276 RepID=A0A9W6XB15_9STRA|nr:unnamed protein product [Phytophthora lilii]
MRVPQAATLLVALHFATFAAASALVNPNVLSSDQRLQLGKAPSLFLQVILYDESTVLKVFANPIVSADKTSVRYDGFATITDKESTYLAVDGDAYVVETVGNESTSVATRTVQCLESIAPFNSIVSALNNASFTSGQSIEGEAMGCTSANEYKTRIGGKNLSLCGSGSSGLIAYGGSIAVFVEYLEAPLRHITAPPGAPACDTVETATIVTPTALTLMTGKGIVQD